MWNFPLDSGRTCRTLAFALDRRTDARKCERNLPDVVANNGTSETLISTQEPTANTCSAWDKVTGLAKVQR
jgi:hypothetical protein